MQGAATVPRSPALGSPLPRGRPDCRAHRGHRGPAAHAPSRCGPPRPDPAAVTRPAGVAAGRGSSRPSWSSLAGIGGGWWFTAGPGRDHRRPRGGGHTLEDASAAIDLAALRVDSTEAFSETVAKGQVISMQPTARTEVSQAVLILLVVSKGPERYEIPRLVGSQASDVAAARSR